MKGTVTIWFLLVYGLSSGQSSIAPRNLAVSHTQTTNLVFPASIVSVDRGSERIVVQKSLNNVLRVKADAAFNDTTNLTVITSDGKFYSFLVYYEKYPAVLNLNLGLQGSVDQDTTLASLAQKALSLRNNLYGVEAREGMFLLSLVGVYSTGEQVICKLKFENRSSLSYIVGGTRFYSRDANTTKRRSTQEREVVPTYISNKEIVVRERGVQIIIVILAKPSLVAIRKLSIDCFEKDGERNISLGIKNRYLLRATVIK